MTEYSVAERLPLVKQPSLLLRPRDKYWDSATAVRSMFREVRCSICPSTVRDS